MIAFVNVNIKMYEKWKIKMYIFFTLQTVFPERRVFLSDGMTAL